MDTVASILSPLNLYYLYLHFYLKYELHSGLLISSIEFLICQRYHCKRPILPTLRPNHSDENHKISGTENQEIVKFTSGGVLLYSCGYLEADVFVRCTTYSNRPRALHWVNTASQQLIFVDRRKFWPTVKSLMLSSTTKLQPVRRRRLAWAAAAEGSLCWYHPLDQSSRENRFQDGTADHGRYFPGGGRHREGGRRWYRLRSQMSLSQPG